MKREASCMPLWVKILISLVVGLPLGVLLLYVGMIVGGLGHGWVTPFWFSFLGPLIYPVVVFRLLNIRDRWLWADFALLGLAAILDLAVYTNTIEEGVHFFYRVGNAAYIWLGFWSLWQVALLLKVAASGWVGRHRSGDAADNHDEV
jgi:hypothetical protein